MSCHIHAMHTNNMILKCNSNINHYNSYYQKCIIKSMKAALAPLPDIKATIKQFFVWRFSPTFGQFADFPLTSVKFPDISRLSLSTRLVVSAVFRAPQHPQLRGGRRPWKGPQGTKHRTVSCEMLQQFTNYNTWPSITVLY